MSILTSSERQTYREHGVIVLRQVFSDWVDTLRAGIDYNSAHPGVYQRVYTKQDKPGRFWGDYCNWQRIAQYRDFVFHSPAAAIAAELMNSKTARFFHEHVLVKEPGTTEKTPWHHDQPYYCVDGEQVCSLWIPLDEVAQATCPEFIVGSHHWGQWFLPRKFSGVDYDHNADHLTRVPDIDNHRDDYNILSWDLQPGDAIAFHFLTLHGAAVTATA
jgi:ectoine hydroxylase-related dioxygenase (phytanoyl-CoA dioxygenase family)